MGHLKNMSCSVFVLSVRCALCDSVHQSHWNCRSARAGCTTTSILSRSSCSTGPACCRLSRPRRTAVSTRVCSSTARLHTTQSLFY